jgi:type I restriction enzyme S subunit
MMRGWTKVAFGDVVQLARERSSEPEADGHERFIGLEHIDPGDLRVRRWGNIADGVTFTNVFKPGQVLFGKRRAYQRKVAVADFGGVCSSDIYVLEPKGEGLLPELLPFICQTDAFFEHAVGTSAGSLSPRTNWDSLASFEFALPPLEEQRRACSALVAARRVADAYADLEAAERCARDASLEHMLRGTNFDGLVLHQVLGLTPRAWPVVPLGDLIRECQYGLSNPLIETGTFPVLRMMNLRDGRIVTEDLKYLDASTAEVASYQLRHGDVLFNRTNSYELVGRTAIYHIEGPHLFASYLVRLVADEMRLLPSYLVEYLNSNYGRQKVMAYASRGVSQCNISASNLLKVLIPLPPLDYQRQVCRRVSVHRSAGNSIGLRLDYAKVTLKRLWEEAMS